MLVNTSLISDFMLGNALTFTKVSTFLIAPWVSLASILLTSPSVMCIIEPSSRYPSAPVFTSLTKVFPSLVSNLTAISPVDTFDNSFPLASTNLALDLTLINSLLFSTVAVTAVFATSFA